MTMSLFIVQISKSGEIVHFTRVSLGLGDSVWHTAWGVSPHIPGPGDVACTLRGVTRLSSSIARSGHRWLQDMCALFSFGF